MKKLLLLLCLTIYSIESNAWGQLGHRIVGEIAESHLNKKAKREVKKILGNETLALSSTWADFVKSDSTFKYINSWHYVNFPAGTTNESLHQQLATDTTANAFNRLAHMTSELKNNKSLTPAQKQMYLRLIVHIVGDIHQPMHAGRPEDLGGNRIQLFWFYEQTNLHRIWDDQLIAHQQLSYTEYTKAINFVTRDEVKKLQSATSQDWLYESSVIASDLYKKVKKGDKLSYNYNFDNIDTLNSQLLKGGVRLAGLLNEIFG